MKKIVLALLAAGLLSGCGLGGPAGKSALVGKCVKDGNEKAACTCMADAAETSLDKDVFEALVVAATGSDAAAEQAMSKLPVEKQLSIAPFAMSVKAKCGVDAAV